ncbi:Tat pathway signal protein [Burkholderia pseudomallei]|uniref:Tat pathway signal protein n=1 Tax=Burkholderia pseudomallei TaxID=28450 RepID=UPI000DC50FDF|nr:Tat pathway signal protein [Burkholderia pseudomallei]RAQ90739.1 Tat pathway signal protein [Burkholderia pseudomallei]
MEPSRRRFVKHRLAAATVAVVVAVAAAKETKETDKVGKVGKAAIVQTAAVRSEPCAMRAAMRARRRARVRRRRAGHFEAAPHEPPTGDFGGRGCDRCVG